MTVSIRPHHLLCILTYLGKGYTPDFVSNYSHVIKRLNAGEELRIVSGPDDICRPMLKEIACHCFNDSVRDRDRLAAEEIGKLLNISLTVNTRIRLTAQSVKLLRRGFSEGALRSACVGCEWQDLCTGIAENEYRGCRLAPPE